MEEDHLDAHWDHRHNTHTFWLANIIPIPKPNKDIYMGTSYRPISLLSVIVNSPEKCLLSYITANTRTINTQHDKSNHSNNMVKTEGDTLGHL